MNDTERIKRTLARHCPARGDIERRYSASAFTTNREARASTGATPGTFYGYAAVFNSRSENFGTADYPYFEVIEKGFFNDVLNDDVRCLFNHDENFILGRSVNGRGTLALVQDSTGLRYECDISDASYARDLAIHMERGDVTQSSFAFRIREDGDRIVVENGVVIRTLKKGGCARLFDCSPVTFPAYTAATSGVRGAIPPGSHSTPISILRKKLDLLTIDDPAPSIRRRRLDLAALE